MKIYCCGCESEVDARLTDGAEIYPHRKDLHNLPFWKCDACGNFVGTHYRTADRTRPLGCVPTPAIKRRRQQIHQALDPIWQSGRMQRSTVYRSISRRVGYEFHTAEVRSEAQALDVLEILEYYHENGKMFPPLKKGADV